MTVPLRVIGRLAPPGFVDADQPSVPMSRDAALHRVRVLLQRVPDEDRDALYRAVIDYGHAAAMEAVNQVNAIIEGLR